MVNLTRVKHHTAATAPASSDGKAPSWVPGCLMELGDAGQDLVFQHSVFSGLGVGASTPSD
ncbi:hypothetical protein QFZ70_002008 [Arthrobacter sp. V1I9]|nr:hypothetical protein [Arthrobacter sp. V1I9]